MRKITFLFVGLLILTSCFRKQEELVHEEVIEPSNVEISLMQVNYAKGFLFSKENDQLYLILRNPSDTSEVYSKIELSTVKKDGAVVIPMNKVALQSTTHIPYVEYLNDEAIGGLCFTDLVKSSHLKAQIESGKVIELKGNQHFDYEKLMALNPDMTFVYPFDMKEIKTLEEMKIKHMLCFEYLEKSMLARAEWIKFFGVLLGKEKEANEQFAKIELAFLSNQNETNKGLTLVNLPFGDNWNVPSGSSATAELLARAGFDYQWKSNKSEGNQEISFEEIIETGMEAENWVIIASRSADFNLGMLIAENELYAKFKSVKNKRVFFCNTGINPYFESANVEPQQLLSDLIEVEKTGQPTKYFVQLK
jgi:iron complex transport system substrate-binding protein